jgi:hypothetical protein
VTPSPPTTRVLEAVRALRSIGFFADRTGSDEDVAAALVDDYRASWGSDPDDDGELLDLDLLRFDQDRAWWEDTEADVLPGNDAYVEAMLGWAAISRGALHPEAVSESWDSPTGPVRIRLSQDGRAHEIVARYLDDYLDMGVLDGLNRVIAESPFRFRIYTPFDQTAFVVACDERERRLLEERGWSFAS